MPKNLNNFLLDNSNSPEYGYFWRPIPPIIRGLQILDTSEGGSLNLINLVKLNGLQGESDELFPSININGLNSASTSSNYPTNTLQQTAKPLIDGTNITGLTFPQQSVQDPDTSVNNAGSSNSILPDQNSTGSNNLTSTYNNNALSANNYTWSPSTALDDGGFSNQTGNLQDYLDVYGDLGQSILEELPDMEEFYEQNHEYFPIWAAMASAIIGDLGPMALALLGSAFGAVLALVAAVADLVAIYVIFVAAFTGLYLLLDFIAKKLHLESSYYDPSSTDGFNQINKTELDAIPPYRPSLYNLNKMNNPDELNLHNLPTAPLDPNYPRLRQAYPIYGNPTGFNTTPPGIRNSNAPSITQPVIKNLTINNTANSSISPADIQKQIAGLLIAATSNTHIKSGIA